MIENYIGLVSNYFSNISRIKFKIELIKLKLGDIAHIKVHTTDIMEHISSIQMENEDILKQKMGMI